MIKITLMNSILLKGDYPSLNKKQQPLPLKFSG